MAATRDGFVIGNGDGILGVVSGAASTPRAFATDMIAINTIAVSPDGRLIAAGNIFGDVEVWELR
jgi:tricorn protease-like protein